MILQYNIYVPIYSLMIPMRIYMSKKFYKTLKFYPKKDTDVLVIWPWGILFILRIA